MTEMMEKGKQATRMWAAAGTPWVAAMAVLCAGAYPVGAAWQAAAAAAGKTAGVKPGAGVPAGLTADAIMEKSLAAVGGRAAMQKMTTLVTRGTISVSGQNMSMNGTVETYVKQPGKLYTRQQLTMNVQGQTREIVTETVIDGKQGWTKDSMSGTVRELPASALAQFAGQSDLRREAEWRNRYTKAELVGTRKVEGTDAYLVRLTPKSGGKPTMEYFDTKTFLPVRMDLIQDTAQGVVPIEMYFSDYRPSGGGIKSAYLIRQRLASLETTIKMTSITVNAPVPDSRFVRPKG